MSLRRTATALIISAFALGGVAACGDDDDDARETIAPEPTATQEEAAAVPTPQELTELLNEASDPAVPTEEKLHLVEGGDEAPELFDQISQLAEDQGAEIEITDSVEGDIPGTVNASAVIRQEGQQDINVDARFIERDGQWQLQQSFACALITNSGLEAPPVCAGQVEDVPAEGAEGEMPADAPMEGAEAPAGQ